MARAKDKEKKDFLIAARKKIGPGITNAPIWVIQRAGRRIFNKRQKRNWREADLGKRFKKAKRKQAKRAAFKSGWKKRKKNRR